MALGREGRREGGYSASPRHSLSVGRSVCRPLARSLALSVGWLVGWPLLTLKDGRTDGPCWGREGGRRTGDECMFPPLLSCSSPLPLLPHFVCSRTGINNGRRKTNPSLFCCGGDRSRKKKSGVFLGNNKRLFLAEVPFLPSFPRRRRHRRFARSPLFLSAHKSTMIEREHKHRNRRRSSLRFFSASISRVV